MALDTSAPPRVWAALAFGLASMSASAILIRFATEADGFTVALWRTGWAVALLAPFAPRVRPEWAKLARRDWLLMGGAGALLGVHFIAWIASLYHTSVASATVLVTMSPLFIAVLGVVALGERPALRTWLAIGVGFVGAVLIGLGDAGAGVFPRAWFGNGLALGAAALFAVYIVIGRAVRQRVSFLAYLLPLNAAAALTAFAGALLAGVDLVPSREVMFWTLLMALFPQLLGHGSFAYAVRYLPAALLGLLTLSEPLFASLFAYALFGEVPVGVALVGMALVLASLAVVIARRRPKVPA